MRNQSDESDEVGAKAVAVAVTTTPQMIDEWLERLETHFGSRYFRNKWLSRAVTIIVADQHLVPDDKPVPWKFWDDYAVIMKAGKQSERYKDPRGALYSQDNEENGHIYNTSETADVDMWLLAIKSDTTSKPPKLTDRPTTEGELYLSPCDMNRWPDYYDEEDGVDVYTKDEKTIGRLSGPFTGPSLKAILDRIDGILNK